jgi:hypothetical protein
MEVLAENRIGRRMLRHITALAYPRATGSDGELDARAYIRDRLLEDDYTLLEHRFTSSLYPGELLPRAGVALLTACLLFAFTAYGSWPAVAAELAGLVLLLLAVATRWPPLLERLYRLRHFGEVESSNLIAVHPHQEARLNVVFTAHYDSKSQTWSGPVRNMLFGAHAVLIASSALSLLAALLFDLPREIILPSLLPACVLALLLQCTISRNGSPGAYDNASGVALLLELAHAYAGEHANANLAFVATGAEEAGLCGAVALMRNEMFAAHFPPERTIVITLDAIGSKGPILVTDRYGLPPVRTGVLVSDLCCKVAARFGLEARSNWVVSGVSMDHIPFAAHGYQSVTLSTAGWNKAFRSMHTTHDVPENLDVPTLELCYAVALEVVDSLPPTAK